MPALLLYSSLNSFVFSRSRALWRSSCCSCGLTLIVLRLVFAFVHWERWGHWLQSALANTMLIVSFPPSSFTGFQLELIFPAGQTAFFCSQSILKWEMSKPSP